ncbi:MAG: hypothetical protein PHW60_03690 [Kiritimatiellae bacterium]|nr:hypothetical protein [Kiritimatiellia bacterium]
MKLDYRTEETGHQQGVDHQGQSWVGFDFSALNDHENFNDPAFRRFIEALDFMARGIALEMFVTVLARHDHAQMKAFEMHMRKMSDHQIGDELHVDHKTAKRWYEDLMATVREISPMGRGKNPSRVENRTH